MTYITGTSDKKLSDPQIIVLGLLVFSVFINYIDRGNLSIAAPMLKDELGPSGAQLGVLLSSFFWTYGLCKCLTLGKFFAGMGMYRGCLSVRVVPNRTIPRLQPAPRN